MFGEEKMSFMSLLLLSVVTIIVLKFWKSIGRAAMFIFVIIALALAWWMFL